jgi:hypothetical protein
VDDSLGDKVFGDLQTQMQIIFFISLQLLDVARSRNLEMGGELTAWDKADGSWSADPFLAQGL